VAVSGTALTDQQIDLLKRYTNNIAFCFDMDEAGQRAAVRSIDMAMAHGLNIKVIQLPSGKDPDESINHDPREWLQAIKNARKIMEYHFDRSFSRYDLADVNQKTKCIDELLLEINKIPNNVERDHWINQLAGRSGAREEALRERFKVVSAGIKSVGVHLSVSAAPAVTPAAPRSKRQVVQDRFISLLLNYPEFLKLAVTDLTPDAVDKLYQPLYRQLIIWYNQNNQMTKENLAVLLRGQTDLEYKETDLERWYLILSHDYVDVSPDFLRHEAITLIQSIKASYVVNRKEALEAELTQAEKSGNKTRVDEIMRDLQQLYREQL